MICTDLMCTDTVGRSGGWAHLSMHIPTITKEKVFTVTLIGLTCCKHVPSSILFKVPETPLAQENGLTNVWRNRQFAHRYGHLVPISRTFASLCPVGGTEGDLGVGGPAQGHNIVEVSQLWAVQMDQVFH